MALGRGNRGAFVLACFSYHEDRVPCGRESCARSLGYLRLESISIDTGRTMWTRPLSIFPPGVLSSAIACITYTRTGVVNEVGCVFGLANPYMRIYL